MRLRRFFGLCLGLLLAMQAQAEDYFLTIYNNTGFDILYVYVSPENSDDWEEDVLGREILEAGESLRVSLDGYDSPMFDVHLIDEDEDTYTFWSIDVSTYDLNVTLEDLD